MSYPINHTEDCPGEDLRRVRGSLGDTLDRCRGCGRFRLVDEPVPERVEVTYREAPRGRYRCREHTHRPVTWRGTGCPECAEQARQRGRRERRRVEPGTNWSLV